MRPHRERPRIWSSKHFQIVLKRFKSYYAVTSKRNLDFTSKQSFAVVIGTKTNTLDKTIISLVNITLDV